MASSKLRTKDELQRAKWAEKYMHVSHGKQYLIDEQGNADNSPFPIHAYFRNKLLGRNVKMLEVNAGTALVEYMVADTITDLKVQVADNQKAEQDFSEWMQEQDYITKLEELARDHFGVGYGVQQPIWTPEETVAVTNVDPATFYPVIPTFTWQEISKTKIISVFQEEDDKKNPWYAFVEIHSAGSVEYKLYQLENADSLTGNEKPLGTLPEFAELQETTATDLEDLALFVVNRHKSSRYLLGESVLYPIWDILQEVSQVQTHIRQEIIKHGRAKIYADRQSLQRVDTKEIASDVRGHASNSKTVMHEQQGAYANANQEFFPVPTGGVIPGYIQRDLQMIEKGSVEIDRLLSRAASIVGCPRSIFNLDEKGAIHVDTEKRKDRRYIRQIILAQRKIAGVAQKMFQTWWAWTQNGDAPEMTATFSSPFDLDQSEVVALMREMNPNGTFVSDREAVRQIWREKKPDEQEALLKEIEDEVQAQATPPTSALLKVPNMQL